MKVEKKKLGKLQFEDHFERIFCIKLVNFFNVEKNNLSLSFRSNFFNPRFWKTEIIIGSICFFGNYGQKKFLV